MKKLSLVLALSLCISGLSACSNSTSNSSAPSNQSSDSSLSVSSPAPSSQPSGEVKKYSIGSGSMGGVLFIMGSGWANVLNDKLAGQVEITAEQTGGQSSNVSMIETGEIEIGIGGTATLFDAYNGKGSWTNGTKYKQARALFPIALPNLTPFTIKGSGIKTLKDLDGKRVGLGSKGASIDSTFRAVFDELGIKPAMIHNDTWSATVSALSDGTIDAVLTQQVAPWPSLTELEATKEVEFMEMSDDELAVISKLFPFYTPSTIKAGTYKGNAGKDIKTLCEWTMMLAGAQLSDEEAYLIVKTTFESHKELMIIHPSFESLTAENAADIPVTWHNGAKKYYDEIGVKLTPPIESFTPKN